MTCASTTIAVAGEWDRNLPAVPATLHRLAVTRPDVRMVVHLGDLTLDAQPNSAYERMLDRLAGECGIQLLVVLGDADDWPRFGPAFAAGAVQVPVGKNIRVLPPAARLNISGTRFLAIGGGADRQHSRHAATRRRLPRQPSKSDVERAIDAGPVDVLLSHEAIDGGTAAGERVIRRHQQLGTAAGADDWARARALPTQLRAALRPAVSVHAQTRVHGSRTHEDGSRVYSVDSVNSTHNVGLLRLDDLHWDWLHAIHRTNQHAVVPDAS